MTQMQLIQHITGFDKHIKVVKLRSKLREQSFSLRELVDLTFYPDKAVAEKASRLLQTMLLKFPESYKDDAGYFVEHVANADCANCKKHFAKIIAHLTSPDVSKDVRMKMKEINFETVVDLCFKWMNDTRMLTRARASSAETLFNLRHRYPWIAEKLSSQLETMMPGAAPMLKAKGSFILSFLHCED
jgi:hypothetical protein